MLPAKSFAPVVTRILYVVFKEKLLLGLVLKIVLPAEVVVLDVVLSANVICELDRESHRGRRRHANHSFTKFSSNPMFIDQV